MRKIRKPQNIDKIAQQVTNAVSKGKPKYQQGSGSEKVWINFQVTKDFKRTFMLACKRKSINASAYLKQAASKLVSSLDTPVKIEEDD